MRLLPTSPDTRRLLAALCCTAILVVAPTSRAGHEVSYYPSFYPQEIRIETLDPAVAARELAGNTLQAYIGSDPGFSGTPPAHLKTFASLHSFVTATINPHSAKLANHDVRCAAIARASDALAKRADLVAHPYPVTPYHADYVGHADRGSGSASSRNAAGGGTMVYRAGDGTETVLAAGAAQHATDWDVRLDEVLIEDVLRRAHAGLGMWPRVPWAKEGWFQAYHLLRGALSDPGDAADADMLYQRLVRRQFDSTAEQINLGRGLVTALTHGCNAQVIAYGTKREYYSDEFSNGIENIAGDSQAGFGSALFVRTVKLKDFPWNGWLRVGMAKQAAARQVMGGWNPVAGFTDPSGRLTWATVGDDAFLPVPYNSRLVANRVEMIDPEDPKSRQSVLIPSDAWAPDPATGRLIKAAPGQGATAMVTYRVSASSFHDGTAMEPADLLYPYALAVRWSAGQAGDTAFDSEVAAATRLMRERFRAARVVRVDERTLTLADLTFTYRSPVIEVYLNSPTAEEQDNGPVAPPWSSVPWHVLALMEAAVERSIAAFSQSEAARRNLPWLDLVREPAQRDKLVELVNEFARTGYRPAALQELVNADAARTRWEALARFVGDSKHLLVTNGPYKLTSWSPEAVVFDVIREFTYPIGLGTFDPFAYPPRALITGMERSGDDVIVTADVEIWMKQQRNRRATRTALKRETMRETYAIRAETQYAVIADDGTVADAGIATWRTDGRFTLSLPKLPPGGYRLLMAVFLDGNAVEPDIGRFEFRSQ